MYAQRSLGANVVWATAANVVRGACQWGVIALLAKHGTTQMVGQYAFGLAVTAPVMLVAGMQLNAVQVTDSEGDFTFGEYLGLKVLAASAALMLLVAGVMLAGLSVTTVWVVSWLALAKACDAVSEVFQSAWQQRERIVPVSMTTMLNATASLALAVAALLTTGDVVWAAAASAAGSLVALVSVLVLARRVACGNGGATWPRWAPRRLSRLLALAWPMGGVGGLLSLNVNVPRYFVQLALGESALGLFAAAAYPMVAADTVMSALAQAASPRLATYRATGDLGAFRGLLLRLTALGALVGTAMLGMAAVAAEPILTWLYSPAYASQSPVFVLVVASVAVRYTFVFVGVAVTAMRVFHLQLWLRAGVFLALCVVTPLWIERAGLWGAAAALVAVAAAEGLAWAFIGHQLIWKPAGFSSSRASLAVEPVGPA